MLWRKACEYGPSFYIPYEKAINMEVSLDCFVKGLLVKIDRVRLFDFS